MPYPASGEKFEEIVKHPLKFFHPTVKKRSVSFWHIENDGSAQSDSEAETGHTSTRPELLRNKSNAHRLWRSRDNRKGRHALLITAPSSQDKYSTPPPTNTFQSILHNLWQMVVYWPYWDVSFLTAQAFTWGSVIWVVNAFYSWLPSVRPSESSKFNAEAANASGITAFIGATVFEIGSVFLMIEAVNEQRSDCFGWAFEDAIHTVPGKLGPVNLVPDHDKCLHHHRNRDNLVGSGPGHQKQKDIVAAADPSTSPSEKLRQQALADKQSWIWAPSLSELRHHYLHSIGFLACLSQFLGATIFWISGFTALPSIQSTLSRSTPALNGAYWFPQVLGGCGFIISSCLFCLETQERWWKPAPRTLGWWIGAWNVIGSFGFTLSGAFGFWRGGGGTYQAGLSTFWGSWAFLVGSIVQWYESLVKHPVEVERGRGVIKG